MSSLLERVLLLKRSEMFGQVGADDLRYVAQALKEEYFFNGDRVFEINDSGDHMYLIETGHIGISTSEDVDSRDLVATLGPGDSFGEMNILDDLPRSATAHVLNDAVLLSLEKAQLNTLIRSYPELGIGLIRALSLRLRDANQRYEDVLRNTED